MNAPVRSDIHCHIDGANGVAVSANHGRDKLGCDYIVLCLSSYPFNLHIYMDAKQADALLANLGHAIQDASVSAHEDATPSQPSTDKDGILEIDWSR